MNIFVLDEDPVLAAQYHCDKHVNKMILESAQMLSTVVGAGYKPTHQSHPCTLWVAESRSNAMWLVQLCEALNEEAAKRYSKTVEHKSWTVIKKLFPLLRQLQGKQRTAFAQAMPETFKKPGDAVEAYRAYYRSKPFVAWKLEQPYWW